jgi:hypothetical protein
VLGALEYKRDTGTRNGTRCEDPHQWMIHSPTVPPRTQDPPTQGARCSGIQERSRHSFVNIVVAEAKELGVSDIFKIIFGEGLAVLELLKEISDWCGWIPLRIH